MVIYSIIHGSLVQSLSLSRLQMPWYQSTQSMGRHDFFWNPDYWIILLNYTSRDTRAIDVDTRMAITDWLQSYYVLTVITFTCLYIVLFSATYSMVIYNSTSCRTINSLANELNIVISADKLFKYILLNACYCLLIIFTVIHSSWFN